MRLLQLTTCFFFVFLVTATLDAQVSQISIPRIDQMPDQPAPYNVRDWREVAVRYDSFLYDVQKTGQYLPLVYVNPVGFNYPERPYFGLHTYVGTNSPLNNEAINVLPSLVGATLCGADKTSQYNRNWVLMSQDFFNKNNGELLYLNNRNGASGNDWWYDLMPNLYFYQLYDLYPGIGGEAELQFNTIAGRFLEAVRHMGGSDAPWQKAYMNYRAWNFKTMQPNAVGVPEPEAAGVYAWVLYNAWTRTHDPALLQGAEWSMEFLSEWNSNPSYELQLPYGIYTAARMNAELGAGYDIEKMVNWSFNRGPLRGWGAVVGTWGGFNVSGLIGEANDNGNDYAFQMNGTQQTAALAPMVRYDKRFARAIGKWILNLANATRLFYPGFLPGSLQDADAWSDAHDPDRVIGYEALREQWQSQSPYSTGDAVQGGWAATNLALYGTSSIGYLGAIVEKTNVDKILKVDVLKTDFYRDAAYPTWLIYNPYPQSRTIELAVGNTPVDIYDAISETFLAQNASGTMNILIPASAAVLITLTPAGGLISYDKNKMLIDGVVVDYLQTAQPFQYIPRVQGLAAAQTSVEFGDSTAVYAKAFDKDSDDLVWTWSATGGIISGDGDEVQWIAPAQAGTYEIMAIVADESGNRDTAFLTVNAVAEINLAPLVPGIEKSAPYVAPGNAITLFCPATDPNGDPLTYVWAGSGGIFTGNGSTVTWTAPATEGIYSIQVTVTDDEGLFTQASTTVLVKLFDAASGDLIAHYPFSGNANDVSGNNLHGQTSGGALIAPDFWGQSASACLLDGINDNVTVPNDPLLNFQDGITVSCWFKPTLLPDHEVFLVSHGSWQNRWKISITPERRIRWTVNTLSTIGDLDSALPVAPDSIYQVAVTYDGTLMALYLNGELHSYRTLSGKIRTAAIPLLIGQILPGTTDFNFKGTIDEVKIFDDALAPEAITQLYENIPTGIGAMPENLQAISLFPNPVRETLYIRLPEGMDHALLSVYDLNGRLILQQNTGTDALPEIDTQLWKPGMYTLVCKSESACLAARFVKI